MCSPTYNATFFYENKSISCLKVIFSHFTTLCLQGKLAVPEDIREGFENVPGALIDMMKGKCHQGKVLLKVSNALDK